MRKLAESWRVWCKICLPIGILCPTFKGKGRAATSRTEERAIFNSSAYIQPEVEDLDEEIDVVFDDIEIDDKQFTIDEHEKAKKLMGKAAAPDETPRDLKILRLHREPKVVQDRQDHVWCRILMSNNNIWYELTQPMQNVSLSNKKAIVLKK